MKTFFLTFGFIMICACQGQKKDERQNELPKILEATTSTQPFDLIGKTIEYRYGKSVYHVTFDNDSEMHWEAISGDETGVKEKETYKLHVLDDQTVFITWGEANGIGVSQVLDFKKGIVYNHLLRGRDVDIMTGEIAILDRE